MRTLLSLLVPLCMFITGLQLMRSFFKNAHKDRRDQLQLLLSEGLVTVAAFDEDHRLCTKRVGLHQKTMFLQRFSFLANGMEWRGTVELDTLPTQRNTLVTYLPDEPAIHALDPAAELATLADKHHTNKLLVGMLLLLVSLAWGGKNIRKALT